MDSPERADRTGVPVFGPEGFPTTKGPPEGSSGGPLLEVLMVPEGGLEPPQTRGLADFESAASTIPPLRQRHLYNIPRVTCPENRLFGTIGPLLRLF